MERCPSVGILILPRQQPSVGTLIHHQTEAQNSNPCYSFKRMVQVPGVGAQCLAAHHGTIYMFPSQRDAFILA